MGLLDLVMLPGRLAVAAAQVTFDLNQIISPQGPLRREGGLADRIMFVVGEGGPVERLADSLAEDKPLGRAMAPGGTLDRLLAEEALLDRLLREDGCLEKLVADGGPLDQLVALGATLQEVLPRLGELSEVVPELHESVTTLSAAVGPLGELAGRLPRPRRRPAAEG